MSYKTLPIPYKATFQPHSYDYGRSMCISMNWKQNGNNHAMGVKEPGSLDDTRIINDRLKQKVLFWFWRRLGAA